jgi:hypothetical protein
VADERFLKVKYASEARACVLYAETPVRVAGQLVELQTLSKDSHFQHFIGGKWLNAVLLSDPVESRNYKFTVKAVCRRALDAKDINYVTRHIRDSLFACDFVFDVVEVTNDDTGEQATSCST